MTSSRAALVVAVVAAGLMSGSGPAAAAPSCVGQSLSYQGVNQYVKTLGFKNLGDSFSTEARQFGGVGQFQAPATKALIQDCR